METRVGLFLLAAAALCMGSNPANAALGESRATIAHDMSALQASKRDSVQKPKYTVEVITTPTGQIKEYVTPNDTIFAFTWKGTSPPDLKPLLGEYFDEYKTGALEHKRKRKTDHRHHRREHFTTTNMMFERGGHMRQSRGRVFCASLAPAGVTIRDIK